MLDHYPVIGYSSNFHILNIMFLLGIGTIVISAIAAIIYRRRQGKILNAPKSKKRFIFTFLGVFGLLASIVSSVMITNLYDWPPLRNAQIYAVEAEITNIEVYPTADRPIIIADLDGVEIPVSFRDVRVMHYENAGPIRLGCQQVYSPNSLDQIRCWLAE